MGYQTTSQAVTARSLHRNRMILWLALGSLGVAAVGSSGLISSSPAATPLLVSVDELSVAAAEPAPLLKREAHGAVTDAAMPADPLMAVHNDEPMLALGRFPFSEANVFAFGRGVVGEMRGEVEEGLTETSSHAAAEAAAPEAGIPEAGAPEAMPMFNGRPVRVARTIEMIVTAYSPDERSCGSSADGITASGYSVFTNGMKLVAADTSILPFGSMISVPGYDNGNIVPVLDRGGAIKGHRLDVLYPTHEQALRWGSQKLTIQVWEYADGEPSDYVPIYHADDSVVRADVKG